MLYPHNQDKELSKELFKNPGSEYRGTPFWAWNCELDQAELLRQLEVFKKMGLGGAHMHVRTGMATPYLSDEHMALIKACVEKCKEEGMLAWLYDEDRWPSGAAGGIVTREERFRSRHLLLTCVPYGSTCSPDAPRSKMMGESFDMSARPNRVESGHLIACYDVVLDENDCLASYRRIAEEEPAQGWKWYAYVETAQPSPWYNNQTYVNTLDKAAMDRFIEVTYERYLETVGEDFGGAVPAIFTDEPQFPHKNALNFAAEEKDIVLPWSEDVPDTFRAAYGEELLDHLPELLWELPEGKTSLIRYHYHDHIAERFAQAFADNCGKWCAEHGLMLTGHMMEEPTLRSQTKALGEAMRSYRSFQLPGIDMLCGELEYTTAKQAQSAARQFGRPGVMSELYGVTHWDFDFRGHKLHGDWQAAMGVTVRVQHLAWVSMKGESKRDYPASINYQSPWWQDYAFVEDHFARVNSALTRGKPVVRVGVIHPVESYWLHWGPLNQTEGIREKLDSQFQNLTKWLITSGIDFDFISESLLPIQCEKGSAPLKVGEMAYDAVIVPGCETLRGTTMERLEAFRAAGGQLIFLDKAPALVDAVPDVRGKALWEKSQQVAFNKEDVLTALAPMRLVDMHSATGSRTQNLVHQLRRDGDGLWLFVAHCCEPVDKDRADKDNVRITVKGRYAVSLYDTQTGDIRPANAKIVGENTIIYAEMYDYDSLLLRLDESAAAQPYAEVKAKPSRRLALPELVDYRLDEPNAYVMDRAEYKLDDGEWQPAEEILRADTAMREWLGWPKGAVTQPWAIPKEPITHTAHLRFRVQSAVEVENVVLALEDADVAVIVFNGERIAAKPEGWYCDKSIQKVKLGTLRKGENVIEVSLPLGKRTYVEWHYLLGDFGVKVMGSARLIVPKPEKLGFGSVTYQDLPHYGGNITFDVPVETSGGALSVTVPHYRGTALRVALDGKELGHIAYPPYRMELGKPDAGRHVLSLTLLGNRENSFGALHRWDDTQSWLPPSSWRTDGTIWTDSYNLKPLGLTTAPWVEETDE